MRVKNYGLEIGNRLPAVPSESLPKPAAAVNPIVAMHFRSRRIIDTFPHRSILRFQIHSLKTNEVFAMALIDCQECGTKVSDRAKACPKCANPLGSRVETIQQTSKKWKAVQLGGAIMAIGGTCGSFAGGKPESVAFYILCVFFGLVLFVIGRIGAWWFHG